MQKPLTFTSSCLFFSLDVSFEDDSDDDIENEEADCGKEYVSDL